MPSHSTPLNEIERRIAALQAGLSQNGFDGALIVQRADLFYFSGTGQDAHLFVPVEGQPLLMVRRDFDRARQESPLEAVLPASSLSELSKPVLACLPRGTKAIGMELDVLPVNNYRLYRDLFQEVKIEDVSPLIKEVRMIKSEYELELIRRAAEMNDAMYRHIGEILREGMTEIELAGMLEGFYRKLGHQGYVRVRSFNQEVFYGHVMSGSNLAVPSCSVGPTGGPGPNASLPQGAGFKKIARHEPVQVDYVGMVGGYMIDQARTFFVGEPPEKFLRIHSEALAIQNALVQQGRPGTKAEELYDTALRMAADANLTQGFMGYPQPVPFVGHGIGLELDELPLVGRKSPHLLQPGMVIALEPKFILPGEGLAGIENSFVVTETNLEKLTRFDDAIQVL
ncbi:MAG: aminopeptidase P family protein [Desulfomonile tiedjei]|nr:aminopeptidase P family protein [Desulfomonile tiedjei]